MSAFEKASIVVEEGAASACFCAFSPNSQALAEPLSSKRGLQRSYVIRMVLLLSAIVVFAAVEGGRLDWIAR